MLLKRLLAAVAVCALLSACVAENTPTGSGNYLQKNPAPHASSPEVLSEEPQETPSEMPVVLRTADETIQLFCDALIRGDSAMLYEAVLSAQGELDDWAGAEISAARFSPREKFDQVGLYDVVITIVDAGGIPLKTGENSMVARVEMPTFSNQDQLYVTLLAPAEKYILMDEWVNDPAISSVMSWRAWHNGDDLFASTDAIDKEGLLDYVIVLASRAFSSDPNEPIYTLTQEQIDATAKKNFGLDSLVKTDSRLYDAKIGQYTLLGSDGSFGRMRPVRSEELPDGGKVIYVETYTDPLEMVAKTSYKYTMAQNDDGSYRFVSAESSSVPQ